MSSSTEPQPRPLPPYPAESCGWHVGGCFTTSIVLLLTVLFVGSPTLEGLSDSLGLIVITYVYPLGPLSILLWLIFVHPILWGLWSLMRRIADDVSTPR